MEEKLLTVREMAELMRYSQKAFSNLSDEQRPPGIKRHGRVWRYWYSTFLDWLDQQEAKSGIRSGLRISRGIKSA
jgi:flavorubredoxin